MIVFRIDNRAQLSLSHLPASVVGQIQDRLTFLNPAHQGAERRGFYTGNISRQIRGYRLNDGRDRLVIPRGFTAQPVAILRGAGVQYRLGDRRRALPEVEFQFLGDLRDFQIEAVDAMASRDFGTLAAAHQRQDGDGAGSGPVSR